MTEASMTITLRMLTLTVVLAASASSVSGCDGQTSCHYGQNDVLADTTWTLTRTENVEDPNAAPPVSESDTLFFNLDDCTVQHGTTTDTVDGEWSTDDDLIELRLADRTLYGAFGSGSLALREDGSPNVFVYAGGFFTPGEGEGEGEGGCDNSCEYAFDGTCDDGGENAEYSVCALGSDCLDCGSR